MKQLNKILYTPFIVLMVTFLLFSCKERSSSDSKIAMDNNTAVSQSFKMVEIPSVITDNDLRVKFLLNHYWDNLDLKDTIANANPANIQEPFRAYLNVLASSDFKSATESIVNLARKVKVSHIKIVTCFMEIFEKSLYDPNSLYKSEEIYLAVVNEMQEGTNFPFELKEKLSFQSKNLNKNRINTKAANINFITPEGKLSSLYNVKSAYILLFFYEPDCHSCNLTADQMMRSPILLNALDKIKVVAVYTGNSEELWKNYNKNLSKEWVVGFDKKQEVVNNSIYDIRSSPSIYLLDANKKILLKDVSFDIAAEYLKSVI